MKNRIKINGIIIFATFLMLVFLHNVFLRKPSLGALDVFAKLCGFALVILGQVIRVSARGFKAENSGQGNVLLKSGPYAVVRNPMYLGILLIGLGIIAMFFKWWVAIVFILIFIQRYLTLILKEEKKLNALFAGEYSEYRKRVPRFLPNVITLFKNDIKSSFPLKKRWFKKEISSILAVLSGIIIVWVWECFW